MFTRSWYVRLDYAMGLDVSHIAMANLLAMVTNTGWMRPEPDEYYFYAIEGN